MSNENIVAAKVEVQRLLDTSFIREVQYPSWLANVVMVKKNNEKWRMCIDFTDLKSVAQRMIFVYPKLTKWLTQPHAVR
jgi:hypothetical protein